jgi:hypothetical protein
MIMGLMNFPKWSTIRPRPGIRRAGTRQILTEVCHADYQNGFRGITSGNSPEDERRSFAPELQQIDCAVTGRWLWMISKIYRKYAFRETE